ncbi:MAG: bifunctional lysylphosphatidylglycerol flippase/synthetase MprF [Pseudomonadota bacterium]
MSASLKNLFLRAKPWLPALMALLLLGLALLALRELTQEINYKDVLVQMRATPVSALLLSAGFTAISFAALACYDLSGLTYLKIRLPWRTVALGSFAGYAMGNTVGMGVLTGGAVRLRVYGAMGMDTIQVAQLMGFISAGFGLGITFIGAIGLLWGAERVETAVGVPAWVIHGVGIFTLCFISWVIYLCSRGRPLVMFGKSMPLPSTRLALIQIGVSALDLLFAALALWVLLPAADVHFMGFLAFYVIGVSLGIILHIPGGVGIFEAMILLAYRDSLPPSALAGALVLFRAIYYLAPLALAVTLLVLREWRSIAQSRVRQKAAELSPIFLAAATITIGIMLLVSGVTPSTDEATELLALHLPLAFVESAHFIGSIAGLGLLFVARGLMLRLDAAWWAALVLAGISFVFTLPKGIALGEMGALGLLLLLLVAGRKEFDRRASLFAQPFSPQWLLMISAVLGAITWLLFFVYRDVPYTDDLWWQFAFDAHAPRSLRAMLAVVLIGFGFALWQAFRPASGEAEPALPEELSRAYDIIQRQPRADAMLALTGDKSLMFSATGNSFLMYGKRGRTWAALFDPIGPEHEWPELIWRFVEHAHDHGGRACFYQASSRSIPLYLDVGLMAHKLGEYAMVPLKDFSVQGSKRAHLRQAISKGERDGLSFEVLPAYAASDLLPELERVSNAWLAEHATREKGFSLGTFDPKYLACTPIAVVRKDGKPVAFANLMATPQQSEATIDLMRYTPDAPKGVMDYLFVKVMLHCQADGYAQFGLGMAPMSGMSTHHKAPHWQRLGRLIYSHGENFYNFRGLRAFKQKFDPVWEPRYLCAEGGIQPLIVFTDIATLVSGGIKGVMGK